MHQRGSNKLANSTFQLVFQQSEQGRMLHLRFAPTMLHRSTPTEFFLAPPRTPTLLLLWIRSCHFCHETLLDLPNVAHVYCSGSGVTVALYSRKLALSSHQNLLAQEFQNKLWDIQSITDISELLIFSLLCMPFYRNIVTTTIFCFS
jgi:hypothetical protein